jgi:D-arabinitol 2-dehydrogenase
MFRSQLLKQTARAAKASSRAAVPRTLPALSSQRSIHSTARLCEKKDDEPFEGSFARTDSSVQVEYPEEGDLPASAPVQGRGGLHFKRTLASFSLEGRVGVVTGGARGLGLVMSQAMVISGADVAIVDLNSMFHLRESTGSSVLRQHRGGSREASRRACSLVQERKPRGREVSSQLV